MMKINLLEKIDPSPLFDTVFRVGFYGILLTVILYSQALIFDASELLSIIAFVSIVTIVEIAWNRGDKKETLLWQFASLLILTLFLLTLMVVSSKVKTSYFRTALVEKRIQHIIDDAPIPIVAANSLGEIKYINKEASGLLGWSQDLIEGKSIAVLMNNADYLVENDKLKKEINTLLPESSKWLNTEDNVFQVRKKNGETFLATLLILEVRYSSELSSEEEIEFYGIIQPVAR